VALLFSQGKFLVLHLDIQCQWWGQVLEPEKTSNSLPPFSVKNPVGMFSPYFLVFLFTWGVRTSLRVSRLIPTGTEINN
jgi:hypothetical protein